MAITDFLHMQPKKSIHHPSDITFLFFLSHFCDLVVPGCAPAVQHHTFLKRLKVSKCIIYYVSTEQAVILWFTCNPLCKAADCTVRDLPHRKLRFSQFWHISTRALPRSQTLCTVSQLPAPLVQLLTSASRAPCSRVSTHKHERGVATDLSFYYDPSDKSDSVPQVTLLREQEVPSVITRPTLFSPRSQKTGG